MRKVIWCCSAAGVLVTGSFLWLAYYACCCPDSLVGRSMQIIAEASIAMQPFTGLTSMAARTNQASSCANQTASPVDESIPDEPQPVALEPKEEIVILHEIEQDAAPIVIHEDDVMPRNEAVQVAPPSIVLNERNFEIADMQGQEIPSKGCPTVMPHCRDDEDGPVAAPKMPPADGSQATEPSVFKAWMDLYTEKKEEKAPVIEELPPPTELEPQDEPKCQEDSHLHEHYPGCPRTTCPYDIKDRMQKYFNRVWDLNSKVKKKGSEESSEEPPLPGEKAYPSKDCKDKEGCPRTKGVDTMEYRKSDAGLDEYGPGPIH